MMQYMKKQHECISEVRQACFNMIAETLKEYRIISRQNIKPNYRQKTLKNLLKRLYYLKNIHLQLGASSVNSAINFIRDYHTGMKNNSDNNKKIVSNKRHNNFNLFNEDEL